MDEALRLSGLFVAYGGIVEVIDSFGFGAKSFLDEGCGDWDWD